MQNLKIILLGGAALAALACDPAIAQNNTPRFDFTALRSGQVVGKTKLHNQGITHQTYTRSVHSYVPFSSFYGHRQPLIGTFYRWVDTHNPCSHPREKTKVNPKKTVYGTVRDMTMSYEGNCSNGPIILYGAGYKITDPNAQGKADFVQVVHEGRFSNSGKRYRATLNLDVDISIGEFPAGSEATR